MATVASEKQTIGETLGPTMGRRRAATGGAPTARFQRVFSPTMPKLLFVTVKTPEVLNKEGKVRFPGSEIAEERLREAGWDVDIVDPTWPKPLDAAKEGGYDAILVSTYKAVPRSRDAASMLSRMQPTPVYTVGVLQKDEAFRTMAPDVGVLKGVKELPLP